MLLDERGLNKTKIITC